MWARLATFYPGKNLKCIYLVTEKFGIDVHVHPFILVETIE
jgi:hypothetical protein